MIKIIVCRNAFASSGCPLDDPDLIWGPDIIDPLLNTTQAAQERGRVEIDRNYTNRISLKLGLYSTEYRKPGDLLSILDPTNFNEMRGKVKSFNLSISKGSREDLQIQRSIELEAINE